MKNMKKLELYKIYNSNITVMCKNFDLVVLSTYSKNCNINNKIKFKIIL